MKKMFKILVMISCLLVACGCQTSHHYTTEQKYKEKRKFNKETGVSEVTKAKVKVKWKRDK